MRDKKMERDILLAMTGELSPAQQEKIDACLRESGEAAAFRDETERLMKAVKTCLPDPEPAQATVDAIVAQAGEMRSGVVIPFPQQTVWFHQASSREADSVRSIP